MGESGVGVNAWHNATTLHPAGLVSVLILGVMTVLLPRRCAIIPLVILACFIPSAQRLVVMGNDFTLMRILVVFGWIRLVLRGEFQEFEWNRLDTMLVLWKISGTVIFTLSYGSLSALVNRCGWVLDGCGMYFFFRCMIREWDDFVFLFRSIIIICFAVTGAFCIERATGRNVFSVFGGVPEITAIRDGRLRCQGAYSHAILAGCFWASTLPWIAASYVKKRDWMSVAALVSVVVVVVNTASSTPVLALAFVVLSMLLYFVRAHLQFLRWSFLILLVFLHFVMNKPVWHLLARVNVVGGSTGWHRYRILDATINNFSEWWLLGEKSPMSWGVWEMRDVTNQYVLEALRGGLLTLACYIVMIAVAFGIVGRSLRATEKVISQRVIVWSIGSSLFVHACVFFAVSYFGQIIMLVYLNLAMIGSLPGILIRTEHDSLEGGLPSDYRHNSEQIEFQSRGSANAN